MKATFEPLGHNDIELVVSPDFGAESLLMAAFLRFDQNVFHVDVERYENGHIKSVRFRAEGGK
jgi:hypothetical protein